MSTYETGYETGYEAGPFETGYETGYEAGPFESTGETGFEAGPFETGYEAEGEQFLGESESPLNEVQEVELATELLEITSEEELEEFLGNLIRGVGKAVGGVIRSPIGQALGGVLKNVAKQALPVVGGALGSMVAPGLGTAFGSKLGSMAAGLFEVELEGMDREQAEFEVARRYVQFAATAARNAALAPPRVPPRRVVRSAVTKSARVYAPGLVRPRRPGYGRPVRRGYAPRGALRGRGGYGFEPGYEPGGYEPGYEPDTEPADASYADAPTGGGQRSGRWVRRGRKVILLGV